MLPALEGGGVERGTVELNRFLVTKGHQSIVISKGGKLVSQIEADEGRHLDWEVGKKSLLTLRYVRRLRRFLIEEGVDVLHLRSRVPAWVAYLAWRGMPAARRPRLVTTVHGFYSVGRLSAIMTKGERVIAVSEAIREYVSTNYPEVDPEIVEVIHRGIDPALYHHDFQPSEDWEQAWLDEFPGCRDKRILVLPGRLTRLKGHADFLRILKDLQSRELPVHGVIVGGVAAGKESYANEVASLLEKMDLARDVTVTGERDDLREVFAFADLSFSLSAKPESFGRTVCEALSLGRPVVGYDHGGVGEQLQALCPSGCVPLGDWRAAADKAATFLEAPPKPRVNDRFVLAHMLERTLSLYESMVSS